MRRVSRIDVGLALAFAGIGYLVWAVVAGVSRDVVQELIKSSAVRHFTLHDSAHVLKIIFVEAGIVIDLVGMAWLAGSLFLVWWSSRQRCSISWAWVSAMGQAIIAALGAVLVGWAAYQPHVVPSDASVPPTATWARVSAMSLPIVVVVAVVLWVVALVWLLIERGRFDRRGPTLRDGLRTNLFR
ncbi:MAG TPA: hypothetical protein VM695_01000 [Phycisphaerae bacterium]|nr:hypothetical protein [Phycisphaerae bacterium]